MAAIVVKIKPRVVSENFIASFKVEEKFFFDLFFDNVVMKWD